jgi:hypothetical protein
VGPDESAVLSRVVWEGEESGFGLLSVWRHSV